MLFEKIQTTVYRCQANVNLNDISKQLDIPMFAENISCAHRKEMTSRTAILGRCFQFTSFSIHPFNFLFFTEGHSKF